MDPKKIDVSGGEAIVTNLGIRVLHNQESSLRRIFDEFLNGLSFLNVEFPIDQEERTDHILFDSVEQISYGARSSPNMSPVRVVTPALFSLFVIALLPLSSIVPGLGFVSSASGVALLTAAALVALSGLFLWSYVRNKTFQEKVEIHMKSGRTYVLTRFDQNARKRLNVIVESYQTE